MRSTLAATPELMRLNRSHRSQSNVLDDLPLVKRPLLGDISFAQIVQSIFERNRTMARTRRSRRSYGAGEWGRNRVRVFPDAKTGLYQIEWRENGRRLTRSLKHRDWRRAKRQSPRESNHGKKSRKFNQGRTICLSCHGTMSDSIPSLQRGKRNQLAGIPSIDTRPGQAHFRGTAFQQGAGPVHLDGYG